MTHRKDSGSADVLADAARTSPATVFDTPDDVVEADNLSTAQKVEILTQWHADAEALQTASDEGMPGDPSGDELEAVNEAQKKVEDDIVSE